MVAGTAPRLVLNEKGLGRNAKNWSSWVTYPAKSLLSPAEFLAPVLTVEAERKGFVQSPFGCMHALKTN